MNARQSERVGTTLPVLIHTGGGGWVPGVVANLGSHGLFIKTNRGVPVNSQVVVTLDLSRQRSTRREQISGTVVHDRNGGVGFHADNPAVSVRDVVMRCAGDEVGAGRVSRWFVTDSSSFESTAASLRA